MPSPTWITLFLDVPRGRWPEALAFWAAATGCVVSAPRGEAGQFRTLVPPRGAAWLRLQAVDEAEPRMHLDLHSSDRSAAVEHSRRLGARDAWTYHDVVVMTSPGGLLMCHTLGEVSPPRMARSGLASLADQICIDIPPRLWDVEVDFWSRLTGRELERGARPEFAFLGDPDPNGAPRMLLQRLGEDAPSVRAHLDFATADRPSEVRRHEQLGARRLGDFDRWTQMLAPSGHVYCLTDRRPETGRV